MTMRDSTPALTCNVWASPCGWLAPVAGASGLRALVFCPSRHELLTALNERYPGAHLGPSDLVDRALGQLQDYFQGRRRSFALPFDLAGMSPFAQTVLQQLQRVPFGATLSYAELAGRAGSPRAARAVGRIMATNPLPIFFPCHRVVAADGRLTGYSAGAGISTKRCLLQWEECQNLPGRGCCPSIPVLPSSRPHRGGSKGGIG